MRTASQFFLPLGMLILGTLAGYARPAGAISEAETRYLMGRVAFGASTADVERFKDASWEQAVDTLLKEARTEPFQAPPDWIFDRPLLPAITKSMRQARRRDRKRAGEALKVWWLREMVVTPGPVGERMTLLWHGHFTSSMKKVKLPSLMYQQNQLLRQHSLGNVRDLLAAVLRDPAMLLYLDNRKNKASHPNENLARELLELFTLGEGHYSEQDVREAARALTGRSVARGTGEMRERKRHHDEGVKQFLGRRGRFDADDLVDVVLDQPRCSVFLSEKLYRALIGEDVDVEEVARLAGVLRAHHYEIRPWLRAALVGDRFRQSRNRGTMIKSPVELVVGTLRTLDLAVPDGELLVKVTKRLGQDVFDPPNVKGWVGGTRWITASTLLARRQLMQRAAEEALDKGQPDPGDPARWLVAAPARELPAAGPGRLTAVLLDPAWQLK